MEGSLPCQYCGKKSLISDSTSGNLVCSSCCAVQEYNNYEVHTGGINGPTGTSIRIGTTGSGNNYTYKETKIYRAQTLMEDLMFRLNFSASRSNEVKNMVERITEGEYGSGDWFRIFVGACAYVVMRKDTKTLPMTEVAALVSCDIHELGRMVTRVIDFLDLKLPEFDIVNLYEHSIKNCSGFNGVERDKIERMLKQGVFLVQCLVKWFVTTGRRPVQVVVAVLVFVGQLNQIDVKIEDVAMELNVAVVTCRLRYKELLERLVDVARALPWGKDVTVKNIVKNAPFVIQYMEMKSISKGGNERSLANVRFDIDDFVGECLKEGADYLTNCYRPYGDENDSKYFEVERSYNCSSVDLEKLQISPECLSLIYSKFLEELSDFQSTLGSGKENRRMRGHDNFLDCTDWWKGKSELCKKLFLKKILEKDVGMDAMPSSFVSGCLAYQRRRERIEAAKIRIENIMRPSNDVSSDVNNCCLSRCVKNGKRKRKLQVDIDWEDFIIETLLLHQVQEEEIEKGHYKNLLDLHVFNSGCL